MSDRHLVIVVAIRDDDWAVDHEAGETADDVLYGTQPYELVSAEWAPAPSVAAGEQAPREGA